METNDAKKVVATICICATVVFVVLLVIILMPRFSQNEPVNEQDTLIVPDFVGLMWSDVSNDRDVRDLYLFSIVDGNDSDHATGEILSQKPDAGSIATMGQRVELVVNGRVEVPEMVRYEQQDAERLLGVLGLSYRVKTEYDDEVQEGCVISFEPVKGTVVDFGTEVTLVISKGKKVNRVRIPDVTGIEEKDAIKILSEAGFVCTIASVADGEVQPGHVSATVPAKNTLVDEGSSVVIKVNNGSADRMVRVPENLVGKKLDEVTRTIEGLGLRVGSVNLDDESSSARDTVVGMSVSSGVDVKEGSSIDLVVSSGRNAPKTLSTDLELPDIDDRVDLKVYQNGTLVDNTVVLLSQKDTYLLTFTGVRGTDNVMVTLDDSVYAQLSFNYDMQSVTIDMLNKASFEELATPAPTFDVWNVVTRPTPGSSSPDDE